MGFSIGANMILKYASITRDSCVFKAIVSIGNPFNVPVCVDDLNRPIKMFYC